MKFIWLILSLAWKFSTAFSDCPKCHLVDCYPNIQPRDCPDDTKFMENVVWGCCPGCVKYLAYGETCDYQTKFERFAKTEQLPCFHEELSYLKSEPWTATNQDDLSVPIIKLFKCGQGYFCNDTLLTCQAEEGSANACAQDEIAYDNWFQSQGQTNTCDYYDWPKSCRPDGFYRRTASKFSVFVEEKAKRKFCVDPLGNRIFGDDKSAENEANQNEMNCKCSRKSWELNQAANRRKNDVTLHCQANGNFEELQCDQGRCWCVNPLSGHVVSRVVHRDLFKYLSCYNAESNGDQYLRRCESRNYAKAKARNFMKLHGLDWLESEGFRCDYDGSFAPVNCKNEQNRCGCVTKSNAWIESYYDADSLEDLFECTCARDKLSDATIGLACDKRGNYAQIQQFKNPQPGSEFCVDQDGFQMTPTYPMPIDSKDKKCFIPKCPARVDECYGRLENGTLYDNGQCKQCVNKCSE